MRRTKAELERELAASDLELDETKQKLDVVNAEYHLTRDSIERRLNEIDRLNTTIRELKSDLRTAHGQIRGLQAAVMEIGTALAIAKGEDI